MATLSGVCRDKTGALVEKFVRANREDTGEIVGSAYSNPTTGAFSITTPLTGKHTLLMYDSAGDPTYAYGQLLIPMEGTNGGTTFSDAYGNTVTPTNCTTIDTTTHFGRSVASFNGSSSILTVADAAGVRIGTGDFTIDGWFYLNAYPASGGYFAIASKYLSANSRWVLYLGNNPTSDSGLRFAFGNGSTFVNAGHANQTATLSSLGIALSTWYYYKVVRKNGTVTVQLGASVLPKTLSSNSYDLSYATAPVVIGAQNGGVFFNGLQQGFRQALFARDTSVPTEPHRGAFTCVEKTEVYSGVVSV